MWFCLRALPNLIVYILKLLNINKDINENFQIKEFLKISENTKQHL